MAKRMGGTSVKSGFYWNLGKWEMTMVPKQGGLLPGTASDKYMKVPVLALLVLAPIMGAAYAIFLPFIGFAMLFGFLGKKALAAVGLGASGVAATMAPSWRPGEAYLAGDKKEAGHEAGDAGAEPKSADAGPQADEPRRPDLHD